MTKQWEVFYDRYNDEGTNIVGTGSIVVSGETEKDARIRFINMLPITGHWMLKIDFVLECDVIWDHDRDS